jgi:hypothetical protein
MEDGRYMGRALSVLLLSPSQLLNFISTGEGMVLEPLPPNGTHSAQHFSPDHWATGSPHHQIDEASSDDEAN